MRIGDLIRASDKPFFSLEFFPPASEAQLGEFFAIADELAALKPLYASVTYGAGGARRQNTLRVTAELARRGLDVMAHLTCVGATAAEIRKFVSGLQANGVNNILALRGDPPKDGQWSWEQGEFRHAADLVRFARPQFPDLGIGVAAYPAPHPEAASFEEDRRHTAEKLAAGADFAITQVFFDPREYVELVRSLHQKGIDAPVVPGILPIQSLESVKRVLSMCGANIPGKFFLELEDAQAKGGVEAVREAGFRYAARQIRQLLAAGAPGIHLYTLNRSGLSKRLICECGLGGAG
ncbi:MAG: methylenetetrahydrofolate reductase [NAD(P)H] [Desulfovibrio sp.]|nr:methylenetetrahydrofolate reductase [NAD(P)H] [Desulfovibrio sp.]